MRRFQRGYPLLAVLAMVLAGCATTAPQPSPMATSDSDAPSDTPSTSPTGTRPPQPTSTSTSSPNPATTGPVPTNNGTAPEPPVSYAYPTTPSVRDWGDPDDANIRPGVDILGGGQCTSNFLFHEGDTRYFLGVAAHCFQDTDDPTYESCPTPTALAPGTSVSIYGRDNEEYTGTLVYSSFHTMNEYGESDGATCGSNDFALVELPESLHDDIHPAVLGFGGPTSLAPAETYLSAGDALYAYANSDSRPTWVMSGEGIESQTEFTEYSDDGWGIMAGVAQPPLVPGDSGGPVLDAEGRAVGALSIVQASISTDPVATRWTNLARALWYMYATEGWAPTLVTSDGFSG